MLTKKQIIERLKKEIIQKPALESDKKSEEKLNALATIAEHLPCYSKGDLNTIITELNLLLNLVFNRDYESFFKKIAYVDISTLIDISNITQRLQKLESSFPNSIFKTDTKAMAASIGTILALDQQNIKHEDDYLADLLSISAFLANKDECHKFFDKLEAKLQKHAAKKGAILVDYKDGLKRLPDDESNPFNKQKILSSFLYQWARDNGYNKERYARIQGLLNRTKFLALLNDKIILKDTGVTQRHGIWSHAIQQYIINEKNKKKRFLIHDPADIYSYLGQKNNEATPSNLFSTWDIIFDRDESQNDYRSPENINDALSEDAWSIKKLEAKYPVLSFSAIQYKQKPLNEEGRYSKKTYYFVYFQPAPKPITVTDSESKQEEVSQYTNGLSG